MMEERKGGSFRPYILDFGIACDLAEPGITNTERIMGTPAYMSPERASGGVADYKGDIEPRFFSRLPLQ